MEAKAAQKHPATAYRQEGTRMRFTSPLFRALSIASVTLVCTGAAHAISCEELRSSVEAKIQSKGVKSFTVTVVDANASAPGQVVGSCELGSKKLVYSQSGTKATTPVQAAASPHSPAPSPKAGVVTECADGRVVTEGSCKR